MAVVCQRWHSAWCHCYHDDCFIGPLHVQMLQGMLAMLFSHECGLVVSAQNAYYGVFRSNRVPEGVNCHAVLV